MIVGYVDELTTEFACGWCLAKDKATAPLHVAAIADGQVIAKGTANKARADLREKFGVNCAFALIFAKLEDRHRIQIAAYDGSDYALLPMAPRAGGPPIRKAMIWYLNPRIDGYQFAATADLMARCGGNTGNLAYVYALEQLTGASKYRPWNEIPDDDGEAAIIPCANQLGSHCDMSWMIDVVRRAKSHVVAVGLGAQSSRNVIPNIPEGTLEWVRAIAARARSSCPNISLRGHFTQKVLAHYGLGDVGMALGCPSLFISPDKQLGRTIRANFRPVRQLAVCCGVPGWGKDVQTMERSLLRLVRNMGGGVVIAQNDKEMLRLARGEGSGMSEASFNHYNGHFLPELSREARLDFWRRHGRVFFDVPSWMEFYRHCDFVIGPRIHGIMLALQAGTPAVCIAHDDRTRELCEIMGIPHMLPRQAPVTLEAMTDLFSAFDPAAFDANRMELLNQFRIFMARNGVRLTR